MFVKIPPSCFPFYSTRSLTLIVLDTPKITSIMIPPGFRKLANIDRQDVCWEIRIPYYRNSISCFLVDIGPISKIFKILLTDLHQLSVPVVSNNLKIVDRRHLEICKNTIPQNEFVIFLYF